MFARINGQKECGLFAFHLNKGQDAIKKRRIKQRISLFTSTSLQQGQQREALAARPENTKGNKDERNAGRAVTLPPEIYAVVFFWRG